MTTLILYAFQISMFCKVKIWAGNPTSTGRSLPGSLWQDICSGLIAETSADRGRLSNLDYASVGACHLDKKSLLDSSRFLVMACVSSLKVLSVGFFKQQA